MATTGQTLPKSHHNPDNGNSYQFISNIKLQIKHTQEKNQILMQHLYQGEESSKKMEYQAR